MASDIAISIPNMVKVAVMVIAAGMVIRFISRSTGINLPQP